MVLKGRDVKLNKKNLTGRSKAYSVSIGSVVIKIYRIHVHVHVNVSATVTTYERFALVHNIFGM